MDPRTRLYLVRHGEVEESFHEIFGGIIDMDLSQNGRRQAKVLARFLAAASLAVCYCSPMKRARQTHALLRDISSLKPIIEKDLREVDFGDWTGLHWEEVARKYNVSVYDWLKLLESGSIPNAESAAAFRQRVAPCLRRIISRHSGKSVAIFCHGGVVRMALSWLLNLPLTALGAFDVDYASVTIVDVNSQRADLRLHNLTPWRSQH